MFGQCVAEALFVLDEAAKARLQAKSIRRLRASGYLGGDRCG